MGAHDLYVSDTTFGTNRNVGHSGSLHAVGFRDSGIGWRDKCDDDWQFPACKSRSLSTQKWCSKQ